MFEVPAGGKKMFSEKGSREDGRKQPREMDERYEFLGKVQETKQRKTLQIR